MLRRAAIAIALGLFTTIAVAWTLALLPLPTRSLGSGTAIAAPASPMIESPLHRLCHEHEGRSGLGWVQFSVGTRTPAVYGIKWASLQGMSPDPETWHFTRADMPLILEALEGFPGARDDPRAPAWPRWLPPVDADADDRLVTWGARAAGWPMLCLRSISRASASDPGLTWSWSLAVRPAGAYSLVRDPAMGSIPLLPEPLGFASNTALYGAAWFVIVTAFSASRRVIRRRRGLCPRCAYTLKGLPADAPCPECGRDAALPSLRSEP